MTVLGERETDTRRPPDGGSLSPSTLTDAERADQAERERHGTWRQAIYERDHERRVAAMNAAIAEPALRADGRCAQCGKPRKHAVRNPYAGDAAIFDAFCSAPCCRKWYGVTENVGGYGVDPNSGSKT